MTLVRIPRGKQTTGNKTEDCGPVPRGYRCLKQVLFACAGACFRKDVRAASHIHIMGAAKRSGSPLPLAPGVPLARRMCCESKAPGSPRHFAGHQRYAGTACAAAPRDSAMEDTLEAMNSVEGVVEPAACAADLAMAGAEGAVCGQLERQSNGEGSGASCCGGGLYDDSKAARPADGNGGPETVPCRNGSSGENGGEGAQAGPRSPTEGIVPQPLTPDLARWVRSFVGWGGLESAEIASCVWGLSPIVPVLIVVRSLFQPAGHCVLICWQASTGSLNHQEMSFLAMCTGDQDSSFLAMCTGDPPMA